ncbi:hypothetical protein [Marinoscillum sp.]|uniref:hypothetical protein n=1 Tax=Marinoscillum sp. TaxID=2024838 RepID=UPI003BAC8F32
MSINHYSNTLGVALLILSALFSSTEAVAQDSTRYQIQTRDGNTYFGHIVQKEIEYILFQTDNIGQITIKFDDINVIRRLGKVTSDERYGGSGDSYRESNTRYRGSNARYHPPNVYLFRSSGFGVKKGEAYYRNAWLILNELNIGFTDHFSLGLGMMPFIGNSLPVWITPKLTLPILKDKVNLGIGALNGVVLGESQSSFGMVYGDLSVGGPSAHISLGAGKGYAEEELTPELLVTFSGAIRISKNITLVSENYTLPDLYLYSLICHQNLSGVNLQYGLLLSDTNSGSLALPWIGVVAPIKTKF